MLRSRLLAIGSILLVVVFAALAVILMTRDAGGESDDVPLVRWTFDEGSGPTASPVAGATTPVELTVVGDAEWGDGYITVGRSSYLVSDGAVTAMADAIATSREVTYEAWFDPHRVDQGIDATIISLTDGRSNDLQLVTNPDDGSTGVVEARIRSALTDGDGRPGATSEEGALGGPLTHLVVVHAGRTIEIWVDGELVDQQQVGPMVGPSAASRLTFGADLNGTTPFAGDLHEFTVYAFALTPAQVAGNLAAGPEGEPDPASVDVVIAAEAETDEEADPSTFLEPDDDGEEVVSGVVFTGIDGDGAVEVWHGTQGPFGELGRAQPLFNIIGSASDPDGVAEVRFTPPGAEEPIVAGLGPNGRRLVSARSFVLEVPASSVGSSATIPVVVVDDGGDETTVQVPITDSDANAADLPVVIDWRGEDGAGDTVDDFADVIDGRWGLSNGEVVTDEVGYDRLVAIGDTSWQDYEVLVPIVVEDIADIVGPNSNAPGVGVIMRWNGHNVLSGDAPQPLQGFRAFEGQQSPFGAISWFRFGGVGGRFQLVDHQNSVRAADPGQFPNGVRHWLRAQVTTESDGRSVYRAKMWQAGEREPDGWTLEFTTVNDGLEPDRGSLLLVAHEVDARFGRVTVTEPGGQGVPTAEATSDAIAEWSFDEGFGPTIGDVTGNGLDLGVPTGADWVDGGLLFNGDDGALSGRATDQVAAILDAREFSLELWADPNGLEQSTLARLFTLQGSSGAVEVGVSPLSGAFDEIEARVRASETDFLGRPGIQVDGVIDGGLVHLVVTHDRSGTTTVFADGVEVASVDDGTIEDWPPDARVSIASTPLGGSGWSGTMLHAALWDRALDGDEVGARFDAGPGVAP
ncbi:MAG: LamG domain-containing protein [Actinomycetota bacterium]